MPKWSQWCQFPANRLDKYELSIYTQWRSTFLELVMVPIVVGRSCTFKCIIGGLEIGGRFARRHRR